MKRVYKIPLVKESGTGVVGMEGIYSQHLAGQKSHHMHSSRPGVSHLDLSKEHLGLGSVLLRRIGVSV